MRERVAALGGSVQRDGRSGMRVRVSLPVEATTEDRRRAALRSERAPVTIRLVLAEDQRMMLGALGVLLELEDDLTVVGTAVDGDEALRLVVSLAPDVLLTDIEMPGPDRPRRRRRDPAPRPAHPRRDPDDVRAQRLPPPCARRRRRRLPAQGRAVRHAGEAIRAVHAGRRAIDPELAAEAWGEADPLTDREREVLRLAGEGLANAEIAERLHLSDGTVRNYMSEAIGKLGVTNRIAAARLARERGWL